VKTLELFNLSGKKALITGSSQGIGYALATGLAGAGAEIIMNGTNKEKLAKSAAKLRETGAIDLFGTKRLGSPGHCTLHGL